jgi:hypothetical protein
LVQSEHAFRGTEECHDALSLTKIKTRSNRLGKYKMDVLKSTQIDAYFLNGRAKYSAIQLRHLINSLLYQKGSVLTIVGHHPILFCIG